MARHVRALVVSGALRRGDRVPQDEIAAHLGVSRIPVREAIITLEHEGWLVVEPHRGAFVHGIDEAWVADHYELMGVIYSLVADRAARRGTDDEIRALGDAAADLAGATGPDDFLVANDRMMRTLVHMARSNRLAATLRDVTDVVPGNFFAEVPGTLEPQRRAMLVTADAVARRDGAAAATALRELAAGQGAAVIAVLRVRGVIDEATPA